LRVSVDGIRNVKIKYSGIGKKEEEKTKEWK
jgi:hypothetical protein